MAAMGAVPVPLASNWLAPAAKDTSRLEVCAATGIAEKRISEHKVENVILLVNLAPW